MSAFFESSGGQRVGSAARSSRRTSPRLGTASQWAATCGLALSLWGCITLPLEWRQDGVKPDQMRYDKAVCEYNAEVLAGPVNAIVTSEQKDARKTQVKKLTSLCMTSRGYKLEQVPIDP